MKIDLKPRKSNETDYISRSITDEGIKHYKSEQVVDKYEVEYK